MFCMNFDYNKNFRLFKFQSGYRKFHLNSLKDDSRKIISAQTDGVVINGVRHIQKLQ